MQENVTFWGLFDKQRQMIVFIVLATAGFFWQVIIPINKIQTTLVQIQIALDEQNEFQNNVATKLAEHDRRLDSLTKDMSLIKQQ